MMKKAVETSNLIFIGLMEFMAHIFVIFCCTMHNLQNQTHHPKLNIYLLRDLDARAQAASNNSHAKS